jgi:CheY-like chemotaxis protein/anti-sigma regulatory factor (Ser/Thr protein kinase)
MKALIAGTDPASYAMLSKRLSAMGCPTLAARDLNTAVQLFLSEQPNIVFLDSALESEDITAALQELRRIAGSNYVPIMVLTNRGDETSMERLVAAGADDFLVKPWSSAALKAKLTAHLRTVHYYGQLARHAGRLEWEKTVACDIFDKIVQKGCLDRSPIKYQLSPAGVLNGDFLLAAENPSGGLLLMLGDMSGHDLSAAAGSLPIAEIFHAMAARGFSLVDIAVEMNTKLRALLPRGMFCAALLAEWNKDTGLLTCWNAGMPDALFLRPGEGIVLRCSSRNPPLSALPSDQLDRTLDHFKARQEDRLFIYSDGLIDLATTSGDNFGQENIEDTLRSVATGNSGFDAIVDRLKAVRASTLLSDDLTYAELNLSPTLIAPGAAPIRAVTRAPKPTARVESKSNCVFELHLGIDVLKKVDVVPEVVRTLTALGITGSEDSYLFTVLRELFTNAVEHGLLKMDSRMKQEENGFALYCEERDRRLAAATQGSARLRVCDHGNGKNELHLEVEDSGDGFDALSYQPPPPEELLPHGRGIMLVRGLCSEVRYSPRGNHVFATFPLNP